MGIWLASECLKAARPKWACMHFQPGEVVGAFSVIAKVRCDRYTLSNMVSIGLVSFISEHKSDPPSAMDFANSLQMSVCVGIMRIMFKLVKIY